VPGLEIAGRVVALGGDVGQVMAVGGELIVRTRNQGTRVRLDIINSLPPEAQKTTAQTAGHGIALANVSDRLRLLHDVEIEFSAGVRDDRYHVRITFPT